MYIILLLIALTTQVDQKAKISYFDTIGESRVKDIPYYLKKDLIRYGESFALTLYNIPIENCIPILSENIEDFFAAYISVDVDCDPEEVIFEIQNHGADFVFLDLSNVEDQDDLVKKNNYKIPVFVMGDLDIEFFKFDSTISRRFINIFFEMTKNKNGNQNNFVKLDFYYIPSYRYSAKFLKTIKKVVTKLQDKIVFEPHLITFSSESDQFINNNCISNGLYCEFDPDNYDNITGRMVILEAIRQKCIFKVDNSFYFDYMIQFYDKCEETFTEECSKSLMSDLGQNFKNVHSCVLRSFQTSATENINYDVNNTILEVEKIKQKTLSLTTFPNIYINNNLYNGSLSDIDLLLSICSSLNDETQNCHNLDLEVVREIRKLPIFLLFGVLFLICFIILVVVCKRIARQRYLKELNVAVNKYVTNYSRIEESRLNNSDVSSENIEIKTFEEKNEKVEKVDN